MAQHAPAAGGPRRSRGHRSAEGQGPAPDGGAATPPPQPGAGWSYKGPARPGREPDWSTASEWSTDPEWGPDPGWGTDPNWGRPAPDQDAASWKRRSLEHRHLD